MRGICKYEICLIWKRPRTGYLLSYKIYRDHLMTQLIGVVPAGAPLKFRDKHATFRDRIKKYTIVSVDGYGISSIPASICIKGKKTIPCK